MLEIRSRLKIARGAYRLEVKGRLKLPFDARQKSRLRTHLESGEDVALMLPRGEILRGGDLVVASDGRIVEVEAQTERVLHIVCATPPDLTRAAYHLGNRHVPVQVGDGFLRIAADHVLEEMLKGLGAQVEPREDAFEPEAGAYGGGHRHNDDEQGHSGKIHHYGEQTAHEHEHGHAQDHAHGHDHGHDHDHEHGHTHGHGHRHGHGSK